MAMGVAGTVGNRTHGLDGNPTAVAMSVNARVATVLFQGLPATALGAPIVPHIRYGSEDYHPGAVQLGTARVLVGGIAMAVGSIPPVPTISCGDALVPAPATTCVTTMI